MAEAAQEKMRAEQPRAASGGALSAEQVARAIADTQGHWDKNNPAYYTVTDIPALAKSLNAALAAHDQATLPAKLTLEDITTALDYASEGRNWRGVKPDLLGNHLNRVLARLADEVPIIHGQAELAAHDQKVREQATLDEHQSHIDFDSELYATLVDPVAEGSIKESEMRKQLLEQARWYRQRVHDLTDFTALLKAADDGLKTWAARHPKWWKRIDHTPIPNDLLVNVVQAICVASRAEETK